MFPKINLERLELLRPLGASDPAPWTWRPQVYTTLTSTHSALKTPRGQELLGHIKKEWQIKMMAVFFFIAYEFERVLNVMRNPKMAHIYYCFVKPFLLLNLNVL